MKEFIVNERQSLKEYTDNHYPQGSLYLTRLLKAKDVKVNGVRVGTNVMLNQGDRVCYYTSARQEEKRLFAIAYEDEEILLVDKDSGVNAEAVFCALSERGECYFIHRLDRNTRGLLVFAKTKGAEAALLKAFQKRTVEKRYEALCFGTFPKQGDVLTAYLVKDERAASVQIFDRPVGERIVTEYRVLERTGEMTRVQITLHTGKTHQIRAHLAHIGCPVVGDEKYGDHKKNGEYACKRQCLIAKELSFHHTGLKADQKTFFSAYDFNTPLL